MVKSIDKKFQDQQNATHDSDKKRDLVVVLENERSEMNKLLFILERRDLNMKSMKPIIFLCVLAFVLLFGVSLYSQDNTEEFLKAVMQGKTGEVENFIDMGIDVNLIYQSRQTPLMFAIGGDNYDMVMLLVSKGADVNIETEKGGSAINVAARMGNKDICEFLLEKGADIEARDNEGKTPLMNAVYNKKRNLVKLLLDKGADVNAKEPNGWSALMFATMLNETESVQILIDAGADVNAQTNDGETALQRAEKIHNAKLADMTEVITVLKKSGAN